MTLPNSPGTAAALADGTAGWRRIGVPSILVDEKGECLDRQSWWRCATTLRMPRDLLSDLDRPIPLVVEAVLLLIRVTRDPRCRRTQFAGGSVGLTVLDVRHPIQGHDGRRINDIARDPRQSAFEIGRVLTDQYGIARAVGDLRALDRGSVGAIAEYATERRCVCSPPDRRCGMAVSRAVVGGLERDLSRVGAEVVENGVIRLFAIMRLGSWTVPAH